MCAMDADAGPTDSFLDEAEFARMLLSRGERRYILTDSSKFGQRALIKVCDFADFDMLISEKLPPATLSEALSNAGVAMNVAAIPG
jgi:DeoR family glycerol-3-phosphate regulon repressor